MTEISTEMVFFESCRIYPEANIKAVKLRAEKNIANATIQKSDNSYTIWVEYKQKENYQ
jgi:bifunctional pyridoxal-dependent enzyme with beta-cystathionase and maltose regulon repressor activities